MEIELLLAFLKWAGCFQKSKYLMDKIQATLAISAFLTLLIQGHFEIILALAVSGIPAAPPSAQDNVFQLEELTTFDSFTQIYYFVLLAFLLITYVVCICFYFRSKKLIKL